MNNIIYDYEVITPKNNIWSYYYDFLNKLDKKSCVKFALFCAKIVNPNTKESNLCIGLVEKWLVDDKSVSRQKLYDAAYVYYAAYYAAHAVYSATNAIYYVTAAFHAAYTAYYAVNFSVATTTKINKYLQILLRKTKQFQNNKILEQISKGDVDKLELVDWNMMSDIMLEEYNIIHEFDYGDIFSRRCLIELLRREYS